MKSLRILKKLSKRAAPLLPLLGETRKQFPAGGGRNYHNCRITSRKDWERSSCHPTWTPTEGRYIDGRYDDILYTTRAGRTMVMRPPCHPLPGTVMIGWTSGYYEPEWEETDAYSALVTTLIDHFTDWSDMDPSEGIPIPRLTRELDTPSKVFRAAEEVITERLCGR